MAGDPGSSNDPKIVNMQNQFENEDNVAISGPDDGLMGQDDSQGQQEVIGMGQGQMEDPDAMH